MLVAKNLEFDMARPFDQFLEINLSGAETAASHRTRALNGGQQLRFIFCRQHADATAATRRFDQHRKTDLARGSNDRVVVIGQHFRTLRHWHAVLGSEITRAGLVTHRVDPFRRRADKLRTGVDHFLRESRIFRQKSVTRMQAVGAGFFQHLDNGVLVEITFACRRRTDGESLARHFQIGRVVIGFRIHRDRGNIHCVQRAQHAGRDSAAVYHQYFSKHQIRIPGTE